MDLQPSRCVVHPRPRDRSAGGGRGWRIEFGGDDLLVGQHEFEELLARLSHSELTVLSLMARGLLSKQIAHHCGTAQSTIKSHVTQVLRKLGARSRTEAAVRYAVHVERRRSASQDERTAA